MAVFQDNLAKLLDDLRKTFGPHAELCASSSSAPNLRKYLRALKVRCLNGTGGWPPWSSLMSRRATARDEADRTKRCSRLPSTTCKAATALPRMP